MRERQELRDDAKKGHSFNLLLEEVGKNCNFIFFFVNAPFLN